MKTTIKKIDAHQRDFIMMEILKPLVDSISWGKKQTGVKAGESGKKKKGMIGGGIGLCVGARRKNSPSGVWKVALPRSSLVGRPLGGPPPGRGEARVKPCAAAGRAAGPMEARALAFLPFAPCTGEGPGLGLEGGLSDIC